jgi:hypothetical protein
MAKNSFNSVSGPKIEEAPAPQTRFMSQYKTDKRGRIIKTEEDLATSQIRDADGTHVTVRGGKRISPPKNKL